MLINQIIKKNNILTDGNLPDSAVLTEKLANVVYANYEKLGERFTIHIKDLCHQLGISNQTRNHLRIKDSINILKQPMELRNFDDKNGNKVRWYVGSFLLRAKVMEDTRDYINIQLDEELIYGMKQHKTYTEIDINISNQFKTKYGIAIWQMYLRYKNQTRAKVPSEITYQMFSIEELNKKFGSNYKTKSEILRCINRGLKEIKKITDKDISVKWQKDFDKFGFFWKKEKQLPNWKKDKHEFISHIRKNHINDFLLDINLGHLKVPLSVNPKGRLYDKLRIAKIDAKQSQKIWDYLFENQNKILCLGQTKMIL